MDLASFINESLALWQVQGTVETRDDLIVVHAGGSSITVERTDEPPFRWFVTAGERKRPCPSILGVLNALRTALGVDRGTPLRVA